MTISAQELSKWTEFLLPKPGAWPNSGPVKIGTLQRSGTMRATFKSAVRKVKMISAFDVFARHDADGSGELGKLEMRQALKDLGIDPDSRLARQQLKYYDADNSGTLDLEEFKNYVKSVQEAEQAFQEIDGERILSLFDTLPCMAAVSNGDRIALLRNASRQFFHVDQHCLIYPPNPSLGSTFSFSTDHIYIIMSGGAPGPLADS